MPSQKRNAVYPNDEAVYPRAREKIEYVVYRKHFNGNTLVRCDCGLVCDFVLHKTALNRISLEAVRWQLTFSFPPLANYFGISEHV